HVFLDADGVDDQRATFPVANRVAIESGLDVIELLLRFAEVYTTYLAVGFLRNVDLRAALHDFERKRATHQSGIAFRYAVRVALRDRLAFGVGLAFCRASLLPLLQ